MKRSFVLAVVINLIFFVNLLAAQSMWLGQKGNSVAIELFKPNLRDSNSSLLTSALFLSGRHSVSQSIIIVGELPMAHFDGSRGSGGFRDGFEYGNSGSSTTIGNPYFGVEIRKQAFPVFAELGLRLPLGTNLDSRATDVGRLTTPERFEAFTNYDVSVKARLNYRRTFATGFLLHLRSGLSAGHSVAQEGGSGNFSTLDYSFQLGYKNEKASFIGGLIGRYLLDGRTFNMSKFAHTGADRTTHQLAAAASAGSGNVLPGVYLSVPIDDSLDDKVDFVLGFNLAIRLK